MLPVLKWLKLPIFCTLALGVTVIISDFVSLPLHRRGIAQPVTGYLDAVASLIQLPGACAVRVVGLSGHHTTPAMWVVIFVINMAGYAVGSVVLFYLMRLKRPAAVQPWGGALVSRRRMLAHAVRGGVVAAAGVCGYSLFLEPRWFRVTRRAVSIRNLPVELDGFTILQITDVHHGPWLSIQYVRHVVEAANALRPDLIALTGDYVHRSPRYIKPVIQELAKLRASTGIVGVLGNHDWWEDGPLTQREFQRASIPLIDNTRLLVTPQRKLVDRADAGICLAGVGDLWEDEQRYDDALGNLPAEMPRILLAHNPDTAEDSRMLRSGHRVDLMLSGHTHGGQIHVPGLGTPIVPSRFGQKYARGLVQGPQFRVHIAHGIGMTVMPLRFGIPPEIVLLELKCG